MTIVGNEIVRGTVPERLVRAAARFEEEMDAITYIGRVAASYHDGKFTLLQWSDASGDHIAFKDDKGWYEYKEAADES